MAASTHPTAAPPSLGLDFGGVIVVAADATADTSFFGDRPLETPPVDGAMEAIASLAAEVFEGRVHVVSKAGPRTEGLTRAWLRHVGFHARTGLGQHQLVFVRERSEKTRVCAELGITHFVDDRLDVLEPMTTVAHRYLFLGGRPGAREPSDVPSWAVVAARWSTLASAIRASISAPTP